MSDDLNLITEQDKSHVAYGLCVLGLMSAGATLGSLAGGQTLLGAAGGTVWGLFSCKRMAMPLKQKLFSQHARLSETEFKQVLASAKQEYPLASKAQLLDLLVRARIEATRSPSKFAC